MALVVIDSSLAAAWLLDDEHHPLAESVISNLGEDGGIVPQLWHFEIRNTLLMAERRGRISKLGIEECIDTVNGLPISTDHAPDFGTCLNLARKNNLTFYDALYLELAIRRDAQLATLDDALARAAAEEGLTPASRRSPNVP